MAKVLQKLRIDKLSLVDRGAGEGCAVVQPKRDADAPPTARAREAALQSAADAYTAETLAKSNRGPRTGEYDQYRARLFAKREPFAEPAPAPVNKAFASLMKRAEGLTAADPSLTVEQHFAKLCEAPANATLFAKAKRPAAATKPKLGKLDVDPQDDDDDLALAPRVPDPDDDDATAQGHDWVGTTPFEGASGDGRGRSTAPYNNDGDNLLQTPRPAPWGAVEGSYDQGHRPASAQTPRVRSLSVRDVGKLNAAVEKRVVKYMARNPGSSRVEATAWATRRPKVQRLLNAS